MSGGEPFSKTFTYLTKDNKKWCPFMHGDKINHDCYKANPMVNNLFQWIDKYIACCKFLDANRFGIEKMTDALTNLKNPEIIIYHETFQSLIEQINGAVNFMEPDISKKLGRFTCQECIRLDESIVCFQNYCFYASVIMAVSAVENRIHEMIKKSDQKLYLTHFRDATLGSLIQVFDENQYKDKKFKKVKKLMPDKHKPLIALLNQYRVFSAHPKEEIITAQIAEAILHLSFTFMMDPKSCPYDKIQLAHK